jgi:hypothetical protein
MALCALALGTIPSAQQTAEVVPGVVHGTVTDQTGGVIVGASVTLVDSRGQKSTTATNDLGAYAFEGIPAGRYTLTVRNKGFMPFTSRVAVRQETGVRIDARLTVAISVTTEVRSGEQPGLSTDPRKNLSALVLTPTEIAALPDDPQRLVQRVLEMAGSTGKPNDVALFVDGFRESQRFPPKSAIEMIRINSNPFSPEFAQPSLDRVEITTKPGSDTFHGEATAQAASSALDARNPLSATKPDAQTLNYTGYFQGPIVKGRLDFLAYAGQWRQDDTVVAHGPLINSAATSVQPLGTAVIAPIATRSGMAGTNLQVANQRVNVSYTMNDETRRNQGLDTGLDLPERAYDRSTRDDVGRLWWTSVGQRTLNDVRFQFTRNFAEANPILAAPAVLVLNAFNGGGNQDVASRSSITGLQGSETLTLQRGRHTIKAGGGVENSSYGSTDRTEMGGTFFFGADVERDRFGHPLLDAAGQTIPVTPLENYQRTVLGLPGYAPSEFWISRGTTAVDVAQWYAGSFVLDDWALSNRMSLSYGLRQDLQSNVASGLYLAPRASLSWLLDENAKNAIKLGAGIFNGRVEPDVTLDTERANGVNRQLLIVERPSGFPAIPPPDVLSAAPIVVHTKAADLRLPYSFVASASYERQLPAGLFAVVQYTYSRGMRLLRLRGVADPGAAPGSSVAQVFQFESSGRSLQRELMVGLRGSHGRFVTLFANYIYGVKYSDTDSPFTTPANSQDLAGEYGYAADDQRHQFVSGTTVQLRGGLSVSPYLVFATGRPINITTGFDNNGDTVFTDRPSFATPGEPGAINTRYGWLNPNPKPGELIIPRNFGREPNVFTLNLSVTQAIYEGISITLDAENLINHPRYVKSDGVVTSPTFGMPIQALSGRELLLSIRAGF